MLTAGATRCYTLRAVPISWRIRLAGSHRRIRRRSVAALPLTGACGDQVAAQESAAPRYHGFAMHGEAKYGPDFAHLDYVNPDAPKEGEITLDAIGTFNSFNEYILEGDAYDTSSGGSRRFYE